MSKIKIGLPSKGRLKEDSISFFQSKKLAIKNSFGERNYFFNIEGKKFLCYFRGLPSQRKTGGHLQCEQSFVVSLFFTLE